jgi:quercetin dioxygenase-like cupin family protein
VRVVPSGDAPAFDLTAHFSADVAARLLDAAAGPDEPVVALTTCGDGSVSGWHRHAERQLLFVTDGQAVVETEGEDPQRAAAGTLVTVDPGERHRHGAAEGGPCTMLTLTWGATDWS